MLIVEDQEPMRSALREFLQSAYPDATIREAADGATRVERGTPLLYYRGGYAQLER